MTIAHPALPDAESCRRSHPGWTILLTSIAYFMVTLDALVVVTALPSIHRDFGSDIGVLQWTVSAYTIAFGGGILTAAALGDRFGRRRVYLVGLALFTAASAACALAPDAGVLIACRVVQGMGAAIVMPLSLTLLTTAFPAEKRGAGSGSGAESPDWRSPAVRSSAARSPRDSAGTGSSGSTSRSDWLRSPARRGDWPRAAARRNGSTSRRSFWSPAGSAFSSGASSPGARAGTGRTPRAWWVSPGECSA